MSQLPRKYCIFGCDALVAHGVACHRFPNPKKNPDLFAAWIAAVGSQLKESDPMKIFNNKRICDHHFDPTSKTAGSRLICSAIPTINLYCIQQTVNTFVETDHNYCGPIRQSGGPMTERIRTEDVTPREQSSNATEPAGVASRFLPTDTKHKKSATLTGISATQAGPSGTGSSKRGLPDDSAAPSTFQGVVKRVRIHSDQGDINYCGPIRQSGGPMTERIRTEDVTPREQSSNATEPAGVAGRFLPTDTKHKKSATLTGISATQAGPSGTGSSKRGLPDDSAAPSTFQGVVKRVRIHSDQGDIKTHARAAKDIPARLAVAICCSPPSRDLTPEEAEQVKAGLEHLLLYNDSTSPLPAFRGYPRIVDGTVQVWCEDDDALTWLTHNVPRLYFPDTDIRLTVLKQSGEPVRPVRTRVKASLFVPRYRGDIRRLHSTLIRQNKWYDMAKWSLYRATTVGGDNYGSYLTLGLPLEEVVKVLSRERRVSYLLGSLYVRFWPSTQPSDSEPDLTDKTKTRAALVETQTYDTALAQLKEDMARATMADDQDSWPLTRSYPELYKFLTSSLGEQHGEYRDEAGEGCSD